MKNEEIRKKQFLKLLELIFEDEPEYVEAKQSMRRTYIKLLNKK